MCYDDYASARSPRNKAFMGTAVLGISFVQLIFGLLALAAQVGYYYYNDWYTEFLILPAFIPILLFIIASIIGIFAGIEKTNGLIMTCLVFGIIIILGTPVSMGLWGMPSLQFYVSFESTEYQDDLLTAIIWGLMIIPIVLWILSIVVVVLCSIALCCPDECGRGGYGSSSKVGMMYAQQPPGTVYGMAPQAQVQPTYLQHVQQAPQVVNVPVSAIRSPMIAGIQQQNRQQQPVFTLIR